jgi:hypothetical protein
VFEKINVKGVPVSGRLFSCLTAENTAVLQPMWRICRLPRIRTT